ncbi:mucin-associated surface protein (MASP) [Trypanosoma cruzi]|nr:mucin-associated surface protein (MASP) [Trypanosoma cruzi]
MFDKYRDLFPPLFCFYCPHALPALRLRPPRTARKDDWKKRPDAAMKCGECCVGWWNSAIFFLNFFFVEQAIYVCTRSFILRCMANEIKVLPNYFPSLFPGVVQIPTVSFFVGKLLPSFLIVR